MKKWTPGGVLLSLVGISVASLSGGIAGTLLIAMLNPGVKGPHITDAQGVGAFVTGALLGAGLAVAAVVWVRRRKDL